MGGGVVGRDQELDLVHRWLNAVRTSGASHVLLVEGEAGIGKTRLVAEVEAAAHNTNMQVLRGSAHELERTRPFGALADALGIVPSSSDTQKARLAHLLLGDVEPPPSLVADGPNLHYLVSEGIAGLVEARATAAPLTVVLEDLHWADPSTLKIVATLARRLAELPLAMLVTFRPMPRPPELERLLDVVVTTGATHLRLGPLQEEAVDALVVAATGARPGPALRVQLAKAQGNPLYVLELLGALGDEGSLDVVEGQVEATRPALPPDLRLTLLRRLTYLGVETLEALRAASVLGTSFDVSHLGLLLDRSTLELLPSLKQALDAGVLREDGERLAFRHDLVRDAIYEDLPQALRAGIHACIGQALAAAGAPALAVAGHLRLGARPGNREAVRWLHSAAAAALGRDPSIAAELLGQAAELADPDIPGYDEILADLAQAKLWSGHMAEAEALARKVLGRAHETSVASRLWTALLLALLAQGRTVDAHHEAQRALEEPEVVGPVRAQLQACAAHARALSGDLDGAAAFADEAQAAGEREGDELAVCMALCAMVNSIGSGGHVAAALVKAEQAADRAVRSPRAGRFHSHLFLGNALSEADRLAEAEVAINDGRRLSEELGTAWNLPMYHLVLGWIRFFSGQWDDAVAEVEAGFAVADEVGTRHGTVSGAAVLALISLHRNNLSGAEEALARGEAERAAAGPGYRGDWLMWAGALLEEARGDPVKGVVALESAWELSTAMGAVCEYPLLGPDLVRLCLAVGRHDRASAVAREVESVAARMATASAQAAALRCRGLAEADPYLLEHAVATARRSSRPLPLAAACEEAATVFYRVEQRAQAVPLLEEAVGGYESLGAARDVARAEATLRAMGIRRGRRGSRPRRPATGWEALTPTEAEVARLVADGATNRQAAERLYKSARTVETHVSHVLAKLGVSSRSELAGLVTRLESEGHRLAPLSALTARASGRASH